MDKEDIIAYAMKTPTNTNPNILRGMLGALESQSGAGLPDVTTEDNGKTLQVEEGSWQVKNADYMKKTIFFSGNATVVASGADTPWILLEGSEGLDSSVKTIIVVRSNATESNTYVLNYDVDGNIWRGGGVELQDFGEHCSLTFSDLTDADYGKIYNITLSTEGIEPNFKTAVEKVASSNILNLIVPTNQISNLMGGYASWDITTEASAVELNQNNAREFFISMTIPTSAEFTLAPNGIWGTGANLDLYRNVYCGFSLSENGFAYFVNAYIAFSDSTTIIHVYVAHAGLTPGMPTD